MKYPKGSSLALGMMLGLVIGVLTDNIAVMIALGTMFGLIGESGNNTKDNEYKDFFSSVLGIGLVIVVVVALSLLGWWILRGEQNDIKGGEMACTMEAMLCPDGSAVGRIPPSCEFAACPSVSQ